MENTSLQVMPTANIEAYKGEIVFTNALADRFISYLDAKPKTVESYRRGLRPFFRYVARRGIRRPTREDIISYREELKQTGHRPTTVQFYIVCVKVLFRWLNMEGLYPDVAVHIKGAKIDRDHKRDYLTAEQVKRVLDGVDVSSSQGLRDYAILALTTTCGLRTIEVIRADIDDLRAVGGFTALFVQGKGREEKAEFVKVSAKVEDAIRRYLSTRGAVKGSDPLFPSVSNNSSGERLSTRSVSGLIKNYLVKAGLNSSRLTAHSLRHTAITLALIANGGNLGEAQQFARHANIQTTMIYNHSLDKAKNGCSDLVSNAIF